MNNPSIAIASKNTKWGILNRAEKRLRKSLIRGTKRRLKGALIQKDYLFARK